MRGQGFIVALAVTAVLVGALLLKGVAQEPPSDPTASVDNGAPAGLLALKLFLEKRGITVVVRRSFGEPWTEEPALLIVPPAEAAGWREDEVTAALERVEDGRLHVLVVCDEDASRNRRAGHWWSALGVSCAPVGGAAHAQALGTMPAYTHRLVVPGTSRVSSVEGELAVPAYVDGDGKGVALRRPAARGFVTVLASSTLLANDGLAKGDNAAFLLSLVPEGGRVVVEESHHRVRGSEAIEKAFGATGPKVAGIALLLLVPFVLLGFAPRRGDPPPSSSQQEPAAARAQARALAALYEKAGVTPELSSALDRGASSRRRSAA